MDRHALKYVDLHPDPLKTDEPSTLAIWLGAAFALGALYLTTVFLFSL